ncbi:MAG: glycosyltransferase [Nitrospirota bacterium]|nr:glycosyltransferase [Nitrospirota bacterium]
MVGPDTMRICYFGTYSDQSGYPMNRVLLAGLEAAGATVIPCHVRVWADAADKMAANGALGMLARAARMALAWLRLGIKFYHLPDYDVLVVGYLGHFDLFLAKALSRFRPRPVVLNALISLYDTVVVDRGMISARNPLARLLWHLDRAAFSMADAVLIDTTTHARHLAETFGIPREKWITVRVGSDPAGLPDFPSPPPVEKPVTVLYFGTYIALHGVPVILRAARKLAGERDIVFRMVGRGQEVASARDMARDLPNVTFVERWVDRPELLAEIAAAHMCLGVFGTGSKTARVIPCKVFDALAMGRPVITADNEAVRELLTGAGDAVLVPAGDSDALARAIRGLAFDPPRRASLGETGFRRFRAGCTPEAIGAGVIAGLASRFPHAAGERS